jgi:hypothetical protein
MIVKLSVLRTLIESAYRRVVDCSPTGVDLLPRLWLKPLETQAKAISQSWHVGCIEPIQPF